MTTVSKVLSLRMEEKTSFSGHASLKGNLKVFYSLDWKLASEILTNENTWLLTISPLRRDQF